MDAVLISNSAYEYTIVLLILLGLWINNIDVYLASLIHISDRFVSILVIWSLFQNKNELNVIWVILIFLFFNEMVNR